MAVYKQNNVLNWCKIKPMKFSIYKNSKWFEITGILILVALAALLRLYDLENIPPGLHSDEAHVGLLAKSILDGGLSGWKISDEHFPYSAWLYFVSFFFYSFGISLYTLKLGSAIIGVLTILFTYLAAREMFNPKVAFFASFLLTFSYWHLHFSRMAYQLICIPFLIALTLYLFFKAINTNKVIFFIASGLIASFGLYIYLSYPVFLIPFVLFVIYTIIIRPKVRVGCFALLIILLSTATPFIQYMNEVNLGRYRNIQYLPDGQFKNSDFMGEAVVLLGKNFLTASKTFFKAHDIDISDGMGIKPLVDPITATLMIIGILICLARLKDEKYPFLVILLLASIGAVAIYSPGSYRRGITALFPLIVIGGIALEYIWNNLGKKPYFKSIVVSLILLVVASYNVNFYFNEFPSNPGVQNAAYAHSFIEGIKYSASLTHNTKVYFYSNWITWDHWNRKLLLPDIGGEDRAFGKADAEISIEKKDEKTVYLFMPEFESLAKKVMDKYPEGNYTESRENGKLVFSAYALT